MAQRGSSFMNGVPELLILRLLQKHEMYGYELVQAIRAETNDVVSLGEGVVYPALHALEKQRALKSRRKEFNGRTRVYYSVTAAGVKRLAALSSQWSRLAGAIRTLVEDKSHATVAI